MKIALQEEWDNLTIEDINRQISRLPSIIKRCLAAKGDSNYHA